MGLRRCQSAGACVGGLACLQDRAKTKGIGDRVFLERVFHKLLLNFTWWVNRKDAEGKKFFRADFWPGQYRGVRPQRTPPDRRPYRTVRCHQLDGHVLPQHAVDGAGTGARQRAYEDVASKFFEHFVYICRAMNNIGGKHIELWDREDGFFYDVLHLPDGEHDAT